MSIRTRPDARDARAEEIAALEEQRDFLLRSLEDLDREHAAGDVDEHDYVNLRDDYTARAARLIRRIDRLRGTGSSPKPASKKRKARKRRDGAATTAGGSAVDPAANGDAAPRETVDGSPASDNEPAVDDEASAEGSVATGATDDDDSAGTAARSPRSAADGSRSSRQGKSWWSRAAVIGCVVVFALGAGLLVAQAAGRRDAGETATGDIRQTTRELLLQAINLGAQQRYDEAIELQDEVLERQPDNVEAMTYKGWFQVLSGQTGPGMLTLIDAVETDPEYPDAHAFLAISFNRIGRPDAALAELDRLDELDTPPMIDQMTEGLRADLEQSAEEQDQEQQ